MADISLAVVWNKIHSLSCQTVYTLDQHVKNEILDFGANGMRRHSERKKKPSFVPRQKFEAVWEKLKKDGKCQRNKRVAPSIVYACLAHLECIEYSLKPETLWLSENRHPFGEVKER